MSTNSLVSTMLAGAHNENGLLMLATFPGDHPAVCHQCNNSFSHWGRGLGRRLGNSCCVWEHLHKSSVVKCEEVKGEAECYYTLPSQISSTPQLPTLPPANSVSDTTVVANSPYFTFSLLAASSSPTFLRALITQIQCGSVSNHLLSVS